MVFLLSDNDLGKLSMTIDEWTAYLNTFKEFFRDPKFLGNKLSGPRPDFFKAD